MKKDAVTNKIRLLKAIQPNPDWLESQRRNLLLHIKSDEETQKSWSLSGFFAFRPQLALKPVIATLLVLGFIFGGGFLTISAAKDSVPGDFLFPIKITLENVQLKLSSQKTALQVEFVSHRAEELNQIVEQPLDLMEKQDRAVKAAGELKDRMAATQSHFEEMGQSEPEQAAEIAKQMVEKNAQSEQVLRETKEKLVEEFDQQESKEIAEVIKIIDETLAVLAKTKNEQAEQEGADVTSETGQPSEVEGSVIIQPTIPLIPSPASESSESSASFDENE